jgi:uncharacterized membrane-anchored protein YhcB (DUF1043 family)
MNQDMTSAKVRTKEQIPREIRERLRELDKQARELDRQVAKTGKRFERFLQSLERSYYRR